MKGGEIEGMNPESQELTPVGLSGVEGLVGGKRKSKKSKKSKKVVKKSKKVVYGITAVM